MIRTRAAASVALAAGAGAAEAQDPADYIDAMAAHSARISPSGKEVALIRRTDPAEQILIVDLAAKQSPVIQPVNRISRVFAIGSDGRNSVQIFQGQLGQLWGNLGSTNLLDELPAEPGYVTISALADSGFGAWRADFMTGRVQPVANGGRQTIDYTTDGTGYAVMRIDATANAKRIFRRASGAQEWLPAGASLTPERCRCAVSIAGVCDPVEMLKVERRDNGGGVQRVLLPAPFDR